MNLMGETIKTCAERTLQLAEALAKDIDPKTFARMPLVNGKRVQTNHPAHVYGHLAIYPARVLQLAGKDASAILPPEEWKKMFGADAQCFDDPEGTIYPGKDELVGAMLSWHRAALPVLAGMSDAEFAVPNAAGGRFAEMMPTLAAAASFLFGPHAMLHLGQVSTWRRVMGLGSAM